MRITTIGAAPVVSVVLIFFNEERFLEEAVRSVCGQTLRNWELILVDDGSTDQSTQIARDAAARDARIRYIDHPGHENRGMAASRNFGAAHTTAAYLAFIDGDDVWVPSKLAEQLDVLESMPDVAMVNGALRSWFSWDPASTMADETWLTGGVADKRINPPEAALTIYPLVEVDGAGTDLLVRRSVFDTVGGFEERFRGMYEDQSFLIKVFLRHPIYISSRAWILYRAHGDAASWQISPTGYLQVRGAFLDWLKHDVDRLGDPRVSAALRRARRLNQYKKFRTSISELRARIRLRSRIRDTYKTVKRGPPS